VRRCVAISATFTNVLAPDTPTCERSPPTTTLHDQGGSPLDRLLIFSRRQLEAVLRVYLAHYNSHRPHRALELHPPEPALPVVAVECIRLDKVHRHDRLGGLLHEYHPKAA
jgi:hypothetical protein